MARLLIIEDGVALASLLVSATSERGHLTSAFHSGGTGLQAASEERFDLAIVDLLLPDLRGAEVLERLRALGVPTIAMSGVFKGDRFARDAVERHGACAFFEKPFELERLLDAVDAEVLRGVAEKADAPRAPSSDAEEPDDDGEDIDLDFDLEIDAPTSEIHLDHPTTELELHPEALEAFQEALEHSAHPSTPEPGPPLPDAGVEVPAGPVPSESVRDGGDDASSPFSDEDAETSFAGVLDDEAPDGPASSPHLSTDDEITAPTPSGPVAEVRSDTTPSSDDEVTAPTPLDPAAHDREAADEGIRAGTDVSPLREETGGDTTSAAAEASGASASTEAPADVSGADGADGARDEGESPSARTLLPDDLTSEAPSPEGDGATSKAIEARDTPEDAAVSGAPQRERAPTDEAEFSFAAMFEDDPGPSASGTGSQEGRPEIPPDVSDHVDQSLEQATQPTTEAAPQTPFSERAAVWEGEPIRSAAFSPKLPPSEASLGEHGLYALLNACHQSRFTGTLHVEGEGERILTLQGGQLAFLRDPHNPEPAASLAESCAQEGRIDEELLEEVRELASHEGLSEDQAVVLMGLLPPEELSTRARERLLPRFTELLRWTDGRLHVTAGARDVEVPEALRVPLARLIFEAILTGDVEAVIEAELPDTLCLAPTDDPPYDLGEIPLNGAQAQLLAHSDGSKSIADLTLLSDLDAPDVRRTLWALVRLGILAPMTRTRSSRRITFGL